MGVLGLFKRKPPQQGAEFNEDLAAMVNKEYQRRQSERKVFELQWRLNNEFITGNQYLSINPISQSIEEVPKTHWHQEREVFNQMATIAETRIARLTRAMPIFRVRPASSDDRDISSAKISTMLLTSAWHDQNMPESYGDFVAWLEFCGTVLWKPVWSTRKGRIIYKGLLQPGMMPPPSNLPPGQMQIPQNADDMVPPRPDEDNTPPELAELMGKDMPETEIREGDLDTAVVPSYEFYPDSSYRNNLRACRSVIHARAYHIEEIEEMWGMQVEPEDVDVMTMQMSGQGVGGIGYFNGTYKMGASKLEKHAVLKEFYERASKRYPQGRFIVVCGKKTLHAGPMPFMVGQDNERDFPFIRAVSIDRPGCFWGMTVIERCIPIQRRYNALRNRKAEYLNLVSIGQWYEPEGSVDDDTELNNAPGNRIKYRAMMNGAKPEPVTFPSLPNSFEMEEHSLLSEFTAVSGVSELSRFSEAPSGVKSGVALAQANEQDDTRIATTSSNIADSITQMGKAWMRLYRQFVQEPRVLRSVGPNRDVEVREWLASDLRSDDVILENGTALAETPSQRRQMVFDLLQAGLFMRPELSNISEEGRQKVFQMLEYGHWESEAEDLFWMQKNRARRENESFRQGIPKPVMDFDDHLIHIQEHNRQRMQAEYEQLLLTPMGPLIDSIMRQHLAEHQIIVAQQMAAQQAMQQEQEQQQAEKKDSAPNQAPQ